MTPSELKKSLSLRKTRLEEPDFSGPTFKERQRNFYLEIICIELLGIFIAICLICFFKDFFILPINY